MKLNVWVTGRYVVEGEDYKSCLWNITKSMERDFKRSYRSYNQFRKTFDIRVEELK